MEQVRVQHLFKVILPTWDLTKLCFQTRTAVVGLFFKDSWAEAKTWTPLKLELSDFSTSGSLINVCVFVCLSGFLRWAGGVFGEFLAPERASSGHGVQPQRQGQQASDSASNHTVHEQPGELSHVIYTLITFNMHCTFNKMGGALKDCQTTCQRQSYSYPTCHGWKTNIVTERQQNHVWVQQHERSSTYSRFSVVLFI